MKKPRRKRRLDREVYLARKKIKAELRARPQQPIPEESKGVTLREPDRSYQPVDLTSALLLSTALVARARAKRRKQP